MARSEALGEQHEVALPQGVIRYRERGGSGEGPPIVFIHGLLVNGDLWRKVVPELAISNRCITPDLPLGSHGRAMEQGADLSPPGLARLIADFVAALDLRDVTLVANDTGGALAQIVVTRHPERIGRLVLTSCDAFDNFLPPAFRPMQKLARVPGLLWLMMRSARNPRLARLPLAFGWLAKRRFEDETLASYTEPSLRDAGVRRDVIAVLRGISSEHTLAAARELHRFERPVLLAWSREDRFFPQEHAAELARLFPNARLEVVDDSYTFSPEDRPERLTELIGDFVGRGRRVRAVAGLPG
jgi:pimeloyl-ACP methyl ester carboxylesterase